MNLATLVEALARHEENDGRGIRFIEGVENESFLSYRELRRRALETLAALQAAGLNAGDELVFQADRSERFVVVFWACLLGGITAVPLSPLNNEEHRFKLFSIWRILKRPHFLTLQAQFDRLQAFSAQHALDKEFMEVSTGTLFIDGLPVGGRPHLPEITSDTTAFIQFSSGSTGDPKGVVLTHRNLLTNIDAMIRGLHPQPAEQLLSWMPLTHDMGLIGFHLTPLVADWPQAIMPTELFIRHPGLWLRKISELRVTLTASPNFGYKYVLKYFRPEENRDLDLSSVRLIFNGAEPISAELCLEFLAAMAPYGLKSSVMFPVYGLAEASLAATFPTPGTELRVLHLDRETLVCGRAVQPAPAGVSFVAVGRPVAHIEVRVCDEENNPLPSDHIGRVQIRGGNVTHGYYNNPEANAAAFTSDGWLDTGDLGLVHDDQFYITGRAKDIIFANGQNIYPHDLERVAEKLPGIDGGKIGVAGFFHHERQRDEVLVFIVHRGSLESFLPLAREVKRFLGRETGIEITSVLPVARIPKTTSGKIQRFKLLEMYRSGELDEAARAVEAVLHARPEGATAAAPADEVEERLLAVWREALENHAVGVEDSFFECGGTSLKAAAASAGIARVFAVDIPPALIFEHPSVRALAPHLRQAAPLGTASLPAAPADRPTPLTAARKRLYVLQKFDEQSTAYNLPQALLWLGELQAERLEEAFRALLARHEVLRTALVERDGAVREEILPTVEWRLPLDEIEEEALPRRMRDFIRPFDLGAPPLLRAALLRLAPQRHVLLIDVHHIAADGTAMAVLLHELTALYDGRELPAPTRTFRDYAVWEEARRDDAALLRQEEYWRREFAAAPPVLELPIDRPRSAVRRFSGRTVHFDLDETINGRFLDLLQSCGATPFMGYLALFQVLLAKLSGQEEIVTGVPAAARVLPECRAMVGMFVNTLALNLRPAVEKTFVEFLGEVREKTLQALANQEYPFDRLVERLALRYDAARNPLFDTMFVLQDDPVAALRTTGYTLQSRPLDPQTAKFDLTLFVTAHDDHWSAALEYAVDLFEPGTIARWAEAFQRLLAAAAAAPHRPLAELEIVSAEERRRLIEEINSVRGDFPQDRGVWESLLEQAERTPQAVAVRDGDLVLTYAELRLRAEALAARLQEAGAGPDRVVAILLDRSADLLIAVWAVSLSGAAYLPVDPGYPPERISFLLQDSAALLVIGDPAHGAALPADRPVLAVNESTGTAGAWRRPTAGPDDLAYVIYTSGTTGRPKGTAITQRGLLNYVCWAIRQYAGDGSPVFPFFTSPAFDLTVTSIFVPFLSGGTVIVYRGDEGGVPLGRILAENLVTAVKLTPSHLKLIRHDTFPGSRVKRFIVGGEDLETALSADIVRAFGGGVEIINEYGPTETVVGCMIYRYNPAVDRRRSVPIGVPADNVRIYVLDAGLRPTAVGVAGEMYVAGPGVARGYLNRPQLTKEKFLPDPFHPQERMYRTGDRACWLADGNLEYLGRIDQQVKIRGFRVEPGEVEAVLQRAVGVREAVVVVRESAAGDRYLSAFVVPEEGAGGDEAEWRRFLAAELPHYMVPARFTVLSSLPLTGNGKVDTRALAGLESRAGEGDAYRAPQGESEQCIAAVWQEVLALPRVGGDDNFYELGGDSIKAVQVVSRLRQHGLQVTVRDILQLQTVRRLAEHAGRGGATAAAGPVSGEKAATPIEHWFFSRGFAVPHHFNQSVLLAFHRPVDAALLERALQELLRHHDGLRLTYRADGSLFIAPPDLPWRLEVREGVGEADLPRLGAEIKGSLDPARPPLWKALLLRSASGDRLLLTAHHLLVDGLSWRTLLEDLAGAYLALAENRAVQLPARTASLPDWAAALGRLLPESELEGEIAYWREAESVSWSLPGQAAASSGSAPQRLEGGLDEEYTGALLRDIHQTYHTDVPILLLTALTRALRRWSGGDVLTVEMENHGRHLEEIDVGRTVGWFTTMYPLRLRLAGDDLAGHIVAVKEEVRRVPRQGLGYGMLKYHYRRLGDPAARSEVRFNYLGRFDAESDNAWFRYEEGDTGPDIAPANAGTSRLAVDSMVRNSRFYVTMTYDGAEFSAAAVSGVMESFLTGIREIVDFLRAEQTVHFTSSDFETLQLSDDDMQEIFQ